MTRREPMTHDEAIELLPWLVNGSLDNDEGQIVEAHAASCVTCRREVAELTALQQSIETLGSVAEPPAPDMRRINARIDAHMEKRSFLQRLAEGWRELTASRWKAAFALQSVVLLVVAGALLLPREPEPVFTTLSSPEQLPAGNYLRVVFDPTLAESDVNEILATGSLTVAAGPSERGVVTLRFAGDVAESERESITANIQNDARVLFAQPVQGVD